MKKRIMGVVLACLMMLPLATFQVGASSEDAKTVSIDSLPQKTELITLLNWMGVYVDMGNWHDCKTITSGNDNIFELVMWLSMENHWNIYPGTNHDFEYGQKDPLNRFSNYGYYIKCSKAKIDWILTNILNCSVSDLNILRSRWEKQTHYNNYVLNLNYRLPNYGYEYEGYYYSIPSDDLGNFGWMYVYLESAKYDGRYYYVDFDAEVEGDTLFHYYATLDLKSIDGKKYWTIYAIDPNQFISFSSVGGFYDVQERDWFADPVQWAVENKITNGTDSNHFSPNATCTTAQILTFLWRAAGSPEPGIPNPFTDVKSSDYFYKAAVWAAEKGLVSGSKFNGSTPCTRSATVTYLWKLSGSPIGGTNTFHDVSSSAPYSQAVAWAVDKGVTSGTGNNKFSPDETCTRGQIVTFLYRWTHL